MIFNRDFTCICDSSGFSQVYGCDYKESFSPTLRQDSIRLITAIAILIGFRIIQINVNLVYLNTPLNETIYMRQKDTNHTEIVTGN